MNSTTASAPRVQSLSGGGLGLALLAHMLWGTYPVVSKRLLAVVPPFSLLALGYGLAALIGLVIWRNAFASQPWRSRAWWLLMIVVGARSATNILSVHYTLAIYVQLINLAAPFAVALLGRAFFNEPIPARTFPALVICSLGSALALGLGTSTSALRLASRDWLGIGLAGTSALCLALYMLLTRYAQRSRRESVNHMFVHQAVFLAGWGLGVGSVRGEDWAAWLTLSPWLWALFGAFVLVNLLGGNLLQIAALARIPSATFSTLIGVRLIAALALGALLVGETLHSPWQIIGALLVLASVTWYVWGSAQHSTKHVSAPSLK